MNDNLTVQIICSLCEGEAAGQVVMGFPRRLRLSMLMLSYGHCLYMSRRKQSIFEVKQAK